MKQITLREAMERRKPNPWTQEELEQKSSVSQSTISAILRGANRNPSINVVQQLEDALGLTRGELRIDVVKTQQTRLPLKRKTA